MPLPLRLCLGTRLDKHNCGTSYAGVYTTGFAELYAAMADFAALIVELPWFLSCFGVAITLEMKMWDRYDFGADMNSRANVNVGML